MKASHLNISINQHRIHVWPAERPDAVAHYFITPHAGKRLTTGVSQITYGSSSRAHSSTDQQHAQAEESRDREAAPRRIHPLVLELVRAAATAPQSSAIHHSHPGV